MKRVFYVFAIFIFISFMAIGCVLNYLAHSSIHKATEVKVKRDLEILATITQGALAKNDYERVEEQVFLWGELEPHIISFEVILDDDIEIIKYAREIQSSHILSLDKTISLPSGRIITFCIKYDLSKIHKDAAIMAVIILSMSSFIAVVFIFLLWRILQRLAFIPLNREIAERKQAEEERSELAKILEGSLNEIYIFDAETLKFLLVNKGARINLGYSMEELKELCPLDLKTKFTAEFFDELLRPLRTKEKKRIGFIAQHQRKDGSFYDVEIYIEMARFRFRPVFVAIILDITERKQDQEQIQNLARFPSENPSPVLRIAKDGTILYSNKAGKLLLGTWGSDIGKKAPDKLQDIIIKTFQFEEFEEIEEIVEDRIFSIIIASVKDAGYANLYARDITERKQAEQEILASELQLRASNQQLIAASETLRKSEEKFRALVETSSDWIWETNDEGVYTYASPQVEDILGYKSEEIIGKSPYSLMPPEEASRMAFFYKELLKTGKPIVALENICLHKDGRCIVLETSGIPVLDNAGNICGYRGMDRDITERKRSEEELQKSEEHLRILFEQAADAIYVCQFDGQFVQVNEEACRSTGYTKEELLCRNVTDINPEIRTPEALSELFNKLSAGGAVTVESKRRRKDGSIFPVEITISCLEMPGGPKILDLVRDITDRKRAEDEREELVKSLEYKNRELQDIVYTASHDLRSPLVNIDGFSGELESDCEQLIELFAKQVQDGDKREQIELIIKENIPESLRFISSGAKKMASLLDGLLQISRIGAVKINSESLDMDKVVREILASMEHQIKKDNILVTVDSLPRCKGDLHMLDHVFTNLISNAIKYRDPAKECQMKISGKVKGNMSIYCVEDNGIGIAPAHQKKVFEIFHRLNPETSASGEGLGLTIVTRVMNRLGGKIWLESEPGIGSKFFIALPRVQ